jgi:hypothetical protein
MQALLYRATDLKVISREESRSLWVELSGRGFRLAEPDLGIPPETPTLFQEIVDAYRNELKFSISEFSKMIRMTEAETQQIYFSEGQRLRLVRPSR